MPSPLAHKLNCYVRLSEDDRMCLADAMGPSRMVAPRTDIIHEGDDPRAINVILDGWACRYRQFANGRRQIVSLLLPGDPCDPHVFLLDEMDHTIGAITPVLLGQISGSAMRDLTARSPRLDLAFHRESLATAAIQRAWSSCHASLNARGSLRSSRREPNSPTFHSSGHALSPGTAVAKYRSGEREPSSGSGECEPSSPGSVISAAPLPARTFLANER